jgi:hypothetical protein
LGKEPFLSSGKEARLGIQAGMSTVFKLTIVTVMHLWQKVLATPTEVTLNYEIKKKLL